MMTVLMYVFFLATWVLLARWVVGWVRFNTRIPLGNREQDVRDLMRARVEWDISEALAKAGVES
jgi:hypothetical protein